MISAKQLPTVKQPGTAAAFIAVLTSQVGVREGHNNDNPYGRWYPLNFAAWCAILISWAADRSGCKKIIPKHAFTPAGASWFKAKDRWHTGRPKVGDIAYFYNAGLGRIAHVEGVVKVYPDGSWLSCGGNTNNTGSREGNGVYLQKRTSTRGGGFGRPDYLPAKKTLLPVDLTKVIAKAKDSGIYDGRVAAALKSEGLPANVKGYAKWQQSKAGGGYSGKDANGIAGADSLGRLGKKYGWKIKP